MILRKKYNLLILFMVIFRGAASLQATPHKNEASLQRAVKQAKTTVSTITALLVLENFYRIECESNAQEKRFTKTFFKETNDPMVQAWIAIELATELLRNDPGNCPCTNHHTSKASLQQAVAQADTTVKKIVALSQLLDYLNTCNTDCYGGNYGVEAKNFLQKTIAKTSDPIVKIWTSITLAEESKYAPSKTEKDLKHAFKQANTSVKKITALSELVDFYEDEYEYENEDEKIGNLLENTVQQTLDPAVKYWASVKLATQCYEEQLTQTSFVEFLESAVEFSPNESIQRWASMKLSEIQARKSTHETETEASLKLAIGQADTPLKTITALVELLHFYSHQGRDEEILEFLSNTAKQKHEPVVQLWVFDRLALIQALRCPCDTETEASLKLAIEQADTPLKTITALVKLLRLYGDGDGDEEELNLLHDTAKQTHDPVVRLWASNQLAEHEAMWRFYTELFDI